VKSRSGWFRLMLILALPLFWRQEPPPPIQSLSSTDLSPALGAVPSAISPKAEKPADISFSTLADETLSRLPLVAALDPGKDYHQPPAEVIEGGREVGVVAEWLEKHPDDKEMGKSFFHRCAEKEEVLTAVRALCLKRYQELGGKAVEQFSPRLRWIADRMPSEKP